MASLSLPYAYAVTHMWAFVVVNTELGGGTTPFYLVLIKKFFWPLQGFVNVYIFLRPRIQSIPRNVLLHCYLSLCFPLR
jgi:hypothetical protein